MTTQTYIVPESNLTELESRVEKLNKRAKKLGIPEIVLAKSPDHVRYEIRQLTVNGESNRCWRKTLDKIENPGTAFLANAFEPTGHAMTWWKVEVTGESPVLKDWSFVAVLEPLQTEDGQVENLVQALPGQVCPDEYRSLIGQCDHCRVNRRRTQTFVVKHTNGSHKCVGRQCIKDFLGYHADPHKLATWAEMLAELSSLCGDSEDEEWLGSSGGGHERGWDLVHFLTLTSCCVRLFGWLGRGKARDEGNYRTPTADRVLWLLTPPNKYETEEDKKERASHVVSEEDKTQAESALEWAKSIPESERQEGDGFLANVNLVARVGTASRKTAGIAAAIVIGYLKSVEKEIKRQQEAARPPSNWIGTVGKRIDCVEVTCSKVIMNESQFGVTGIHKLTDAAGNDLVWFASGGLKIKEGDKVVISAGVKEHGEFRSRKQTILTRVTVWTAEGVAEYKTKQERKVAREAKKAAK